MAKKTYYDILDVHIAATANEIKDSYRLHASAWHPDKHVGSNKKRAEDRMTLLNEAYSILRDPKKRADYDRTLNQQDTKETRANSAHSTSAHSTKDVTPDVREAAQHENVEWQAKKSSETAEDIRRRNVEYKNQKTREYIDITRQNPEEYKRAEREEIERRVRAGRPKYDQFDVAERQRIVERIEVLLREKMERDKEESGYQRHSLAETVMSRFKRIVGKS